jgi:hypothetical protein
MTEVTAEVAGQPGEDDGDTVHAELELGVMAECLSILSQLPWGGQNRVLTWLRSRIQDDRMAAAQQTPLVDYC